MSQTDETFINMIALVTVYDIKYLYDHRRVLLLLDLELFPHSKNIKLLSLYQIDMKWHISNEIWHRIRRHHYFIEYVET